MAGASHDGSPAGFEDGLFHVHGALDVVNHAQVFVVSGVFGQFVFVLEQVVCKKGNESVRVDETARFVDRTDAVAVAVSAEAKFASVVNHGLAQIHHVLWSGRVGSVVGFRGVPIAKQVDVVNPHLGQQFNHVGPRHGVAAVHRHLDGARHRTRGLNDGVEVRIHVGLVDDLPASLDELTVEKDRL